jgi:hypothetical protein
VSTSQAGAGSAIASFAWDLTGTNAFSMPGGVANETFLTAGPHIVRLLVTDADGQTSLAQQTIDVASAPLALMHPFPVVNLNGRLTSAGVTIRTLTVVAPVGARVQGQCSGAGCPTRSETAVAAVKKGHHRGATVTVHLTRLEGTLRAGAVLKISVTMPGVMGKFTKFVIRRDAVPARTDLCIAQPKAAPVACSAS